MSGVGTMFVGIGVILIYLLIIGIGIADYIVTSLGVYRLASRRQIQRPWWAWIPVVNDLLLGRITEDCDARNGRKRKWSTVMLVLSLIYVGGGLLFLVAYFCVMLVAMTQAMIMNGDPTGAIVVVFFVIMIAAVIWGLAAAAYTACRYVCIYKVFESIAPEKTLKYFLLALLVPFAYGILLMKCCRKGYVEPMEEQPIDASSVETDSTEEMQEEEYYQ